MEVTENELAGAIETVRLDAMDGNIGLSGLSSSAIAARIFVALNGHSTQPADDEDGPCEFIRDPELAAVAAILAALQSLMPCEPEDTRRVLAYVADRHGYVIADED